MSQSSENTPPHKERLFYSLLGLLLITLLIGCLFAKKYTDEASLKQTIERLEDQGEKLTFEALGVPMVQEASPDFKEIQKLNTEIKKVFEASPLDGLPALYAVSTQAFPSKYLTWRSESKREEPITWEVLENEWKAVTPFLQQLHLLLMRDSTVITPSRNYGQGLAMQVDDQMLSLATVRTLQTDAYLALHRQDFGRFLESFETSFRLTHLSHDNVLLISHLVYITHLSLLSKVSWEALQYPDLDREYLQQLAELWNGISILNHTEPAIEGERVIMFLSLPKLQKDDTLATLTIHPPKTLPFRGLHKFLFASADFKKMLLTFQEMIDMSRELEATGSYLSIKRKCDTLTDSLTHGTSYDNFRYLLTHLTISGASELIVKAVKEEAKVRQTQIAIALERFQRAEQTYPETLDKLTPQFLQSVPLDPMNAKPMRYESQSPNSFLLYSVGEDGIDDGGNPSLDLVWGKTR